MFDVSVTETSDQYRVAVDSTLSLEGSHLADLCPSKEARPVACDDVATETGPGTRYEIAVPKHTWPWGRESLAKDISDRLLGVASHKLVWQVDGSPFPNRSSTVIWETMKRGTPGARHELADIQCEWVNDVRSDQKLRQRTVVTWINEHEFEVRLKARVERRLLLIGWIDTYLNNGLDAARAYGIKNGLVQI